MHLVLLFVAQKLVNARVRSFTDNHNVARILQVGSRKPDLHSIALNVFNIAIQYQIHLEPEWVPRELNQRTDLLSRIVDYDDWIRCGDATQLTDLRIIITTNCRNSIAGAGILVQKQ